MDTVAPAFPKHLEKRWGIGSAAVIADTHTSHVYRVLRTDGSAAIAKLLKPQGLHELPGIDFLSWRHGSGAIKLLDRLDNACLLEDAGMMTLREWRLEHGEGEANAIIVGVVCELHSPAIAAPPADLLPLRQHFRALFEQAADRHGTEISEPLAGCAAVAEVLIEAQTDIRPLHGDLHHDNIISGGLRGWLAIDPQGLIGDPAYEVANIFGNPDGAFADIVDPGRIIALVRLFAPVIGCSEEKILRYAIAHAGLSISWAIEDGRPLGQGSDAFERHAFLKVAGRLLQERVFSS
jgi:streptomycin 6-kinase